MMPEFMLPDPCHCARLYLGKALKHFSFITNTQQPFLLEFLGDILPFPNEFLRNLCLACTNSDLYLSVTENKLTFYLLDVVNCRQLHYYFINLMSLIGGSQALQISAHQTQMGRIQQPHMYLTRPRQRITQSDVQAINTI